MSGHRPYFFSGCFLGLFLLLWAVSSVAQPLSSGDLFAAIQQRNASSVERILLAGASPDVRDPQAILAFQTPLALAVTSNQPDLVTLLLAHGADINLRVGFWHNLSPLYLAVKSGNLPIAQQLVEAGSRVDPNRWTALKELLSAPLNLLRGKTIDLRRPPSLREAAEASGNRELVEYLQRLGAR